MVVHKNSHTERNKTQIQTGSPYSTHIFFLVYIVPPQFPSCQPPLNDKLSSFFSDPLPSEVHFRHCLCPCVCLLHCVECWCSLRGENLHTPVLVCCFCFPARLWSSTGLSPVCGVWCVLGGWEPAALFCCFSEKLFHANVTSRCPCQWEKMN